jgi:hypothetical protein
LCFQCNDVTWNWHCILSQRVHTNLATFSSVS